MPSWKNVYLLFDKNGDGDISLEEWKEGMASLGVTKNVPEMFKAVDADGSGEMPHVCKIKYIILKTQQNSAHWAQ